MRKNLITRTLEEANLLYRNERKAKYNTKNLMKLETTFKRKFITRPDFAEQGCLSEMGTTYVYELIKGHLPCEISGQIYTNELLPFLEKENTKNEYQFVLLSLYCWKKSNWNGDLDIESEDDCKTYWLYSEKEDLIVKIVLNKDSTDLYASSLQLENLDKFLEYIKRFVFLKQENHIGIINNTSSGNLNLQTVKIDKVELDLELNYGPNFEPVHQSILKKLNDKKTGLFLLHSTPGNGKSFYIKYLSQVVKNRLFVYIPTSMTDAIVQPNLISLLLKYPNSVLIIEDAEQAIMSRDENIGNASLVSNILNISDGILGSILSVALILTFNTNRTSIDPALLRKGRLQVEWEFKELPEENAKKLAIKLGKNPDKITGPTKLCDIYNMDDCNFHMEKETVKIGFGQ